MEFCRHIWFHHSLDNWKLQRNSFLERRALLGFSWFQSFYQLYFLNQWEKKHWTFDSYFLLSFGFLVCGNTPFCKNVYVELFEVKEEISWFSQLDLFHIFSWRTTIFLHFIDEFYYIFDFCQTIILSVIWIKSQVFLFTLHSFVPC